MASWLSACRSALRVLRRQPTFALISLATLGLGIGANTAIFSIIRGVVLNPLPYKDPERLAVVWEVNPTGSTEPVAVPTYNDWKADARTIEALAAYRHVDFTFTGSGDPQSVAGLRTTAELFDVLRAGARHGRTFT